MAEEIKIMNLAGMQYYDEKIKGYIATADEQTLTDAKAYADGLADNYDAAGVAATKVQELADGAVKANTEAIAKLNGAADAEGSVAKAVADAKALVDADVAALAGRVTVNEGDIAAIKEDIGNVDDLETTNKELVKALNEVRNAVSAGGVSAAVTMDTTTTTEGALKSYTIKQGENVVGVIDIPKDMVVESGSVVTLEEGNEEGLAAGTYIKLVLANVTDPLFINAASLVDIYKAQENAAQVQLAINSDTREISATIVAESITATELAADSVTTVKIADKNVTKAKLSAEVQASLDKADASAAQTALNEEIARAKAAEEKALTDAKAYADGLNTAMDERMDAVEAMLAGEGEGTVDEKIEAAKAAAIAAAAEDATTKANTAESNAKAHATELNNAMDERMQAVEAKAHEHANKDELDLIQTGDKAKWDAAQANAEATAAAALAAAKEELDGEISGHDTRIADLETKVGAGFVEITTDEIDAMFTDEVYTFNRVAHGKY